MVSLISDRVVALKYLFGLSDDVTRSFDFPEENINYILDLSTILSSKATVDDCLVTSHMQIPLYQVKFHFNTGSCLLFFSLNHFLTSLDVSGTRFLSQ